MRTPQIMHYFCEHGNEFVLITFQWLFPDNNTIILGAVLMVNNKPQGLMLVPPCVLSTKTYLAPPPYIKIDFYRDEIITAAAGNVDIQ
jgi:hypothetical protein